MVGALQSLAVELLAGQGDYDCEVCVNASGYALDLPSSVDTLPASASGPRGVMQYKRALGAARRIRQSYQRVDVAIPHPFHAIGNYLAFALGADSVDLLPDGILNYYPRQLSPVDLRAMRKKSLFMRALGYSYQPYTGALDGCDSLSYNRAYSFFSSGMSSRATSIEPLRLSQQSSLSSSGILFVDQPVARQHLSGLAGVRAHVESVVRTGDRVFLKQHPSRATPSYFPPHLNATILENTAPIEKTAPSLPLDRVVGVSSSSLLTLKLINPRLDCVAIGLRSLVARQPELAAVVQVYEKAGIELLD